MATGVSSWSTTAATNATADSNVNWSEGQAPSTVNNSARALMASVALWRNDISGTLVTGGTSTAYTVATQQGFASLAALDGAMLCIGMHATNGASPTLSVDGLTAKPIVTATGAAVAAGRLVLSSFYVVTYFNASNEFRLQSVFGSEFASGTIMLFMQTSAPTGWTKYVALDDRALRLVSGTASAGGTAAFSSVFAARTILQANLPNVNFTVTIPAGEGSHTHALVNGSNILTSAASGGSGAGSSGAATQIANATLPQMAGTAASGGSGTAMDFAVQYVDVIAATKD